MRSFSSADQRRRRPTSMTSRRSGRRLYVWLSIRAVSIADGSSHKAPLAGGIPAKEIKTLISTSTGQASVGVGLVRRTGLALDGIVQRVGELHTLTGTIVSAAEGQSNSLVEVNAALVEADKVTQSNAAMTEDTSAAIYALQDDAEELVQLVAQFSLRSAQEPRSAPLRPAPPLKLIAGGGVGLSATG